LSEWKGNVGNKYSNELNYHSKLNRYNRFQIKPNQLENLPNEMDIYVRIQSEPLL
jgi:hypothetical protein